MIAKQNNFETSFVILCLITLTLLRIFLAYKLNEINAFEQYDVFFDADTVHYLGAIANGWTVSGLNHPAYALIVNVPIRAIDYAISSAGIANSGAFRDQAAILMAPLVSLMGGIFWWLATVKAGFSTWARVCGFLLFQFSFSQTVFSIIPESYSLSGALMGLLLLLTVGAAKDPTQMNSKKVQALWMGLAIIMSGITITNGFLCIAVWFALRFSKNALLSLAVEISAAFGILLFSVALGMTADNLVYERSLNSPLSSAKTSETFQVQRTKYSSTEFDTGIPSAFASSIFANTIEQVANTVGQPSDKYQFRFSIEGSSKSWNSKVLGWIVLTAVVTILLKSQGFSRIVRAICAVLLFNGLLHSAFGLETFLYSQHWLAFLCFALIAPFSNHETKLAKFYLTFVVCVTGGLSFNAMNHILSQLNGWAPT